MNPVTVLRITVGERVNQSCDLSAEGSTVNGARDTAPSLASESRDVGPDPLLR